MNNSVSTMTGKTKLKVVLLGNQAVGKSSIIEKYVKDIFDDSNNPTVGIDFLVKNVMHKGKNYRLQLWDTAGQERFRSLIPNYLKDAKCAIIIIDVTSKASLNSAESWLSLYNDNKTGDGFTFLVGNKIDLEYREVTQEEAQQKAKEMGIPYFEVSAKTGANIQQFFTKLIDVSQQQSISAANFDLDPRKATKDNNNSSKNTDTIKQEQQNKQQDEQHRKTSAKHEETAGNIVLKNQKLEDKKNAGKNKSGGCC